MMICEVQKEVKHLSKSARSMATFPDDILSVIFLRLPARSLIRFRCVCKSWNSFLTSPFFIKAYHERSIKLHKFHLLKDDFNGLSRAQIHHPPKKELCNLDISSLHNGKNFKIVGSCNGIVCLSSFDSENSDHSRIILWNPSSGENIALPTPKFDVSSLVGFRFESLHRCLDVGFGFDPSNGHLDDFRVVKILIEHRRFVNTNSNVEVYSFRRNCWEQLGNIFPPTVALPLGEQVIFGNFICWWPSHVRFHREGILLILFDVVENVFQELALPDIMSPKERCISLYKGCLSMIVHNSSTTNYEVWIMNEFGVRESWTKLYTVYMPTNGIEHYRPLGFADSGDVFFVWRIYFGLRHRCPTGLVLYNVQRQQFEACKVGMNSYHSAQVVTCMESLISLSPINNVEH